MLARLTVQYVSTSVHPYASTTVGQYVSTPASQYARTSVRRYVSTPVRQHERTPVHQYGSTTVRQRVSTPVRLFLLVFPACGATAPTPPVKQDVLLVLHEREEGLERGRSGPEQGDELPADAHRP